MLCRWPMECSREEVSPAGSHNSHRLSVPAMPLLAALVAATAPFDCTSVSTFANSFRFLLVTSNVCHALDLATQVYFL